MSNKGDAYAIATAIYAGTRGQAIIDIDDLSDRLYRVIDSCQLGSDDTKADIYAQLAENLTADTVFADAVLIVEAAIEETRRHA